jgi:RNA recognition motif-containing protein
MLKHSHLFESIPSGYIKGAFLDRIHFYSPGWEVRILKEAVFSEGYGFIEFNTRATAEKVLQTYQGTIMPNGGQSYRLNWATFSAGERSSRQDDGPDHTIFVGDLAADVTDYLLQETFRARYNSVKGAKVVIDRLTGRSKGYGFVRFADEGEQMRAMTEMQGVLCSTRPMRIGPATNKNPAATTQPKGLCLISYI